MTGVPRQFNFEVIRHMMTRATMTTAMLWISEKVKKITILSLSDRVIMDTHSVQLFVNKIYTYILYFVL